MMYRVSFPLVSILLMLTVAPKARADDWPMPRHDAGNTGLSTETLRPPFRLAWRQALYHSPEPTSLLSSGGAICISRRPEYASESTEVTLLNNSGRLLWQLSHARAVYLKGPLLVVIHDHEDGSTLEAWNWKERTLGWSSRIGGLVEAYWGAVENNRKLICALEYRPPAQGDSGWGFLKAALRVVDLEDGSIIATWDGGIQEWSVGPPACDGKNVYFGASHWLREYDATTLLPKWGAYDGGNAYPIWTGHMLLVKGWLHVLHGWDIEHRHEIWSGGAPRDLPHCLANGVDGEMLLTESSSVLDISTGKAVSRLIVGRYPVYARSTVAAGHFVFVSGMRSYGAKTGGFYAFEAATGRLRWRYERTGLAGTQIIVSDGRVIGAGSDGFLYSFAPVRNTQHKRAKRKHG
jgi:hypothetical protein